MHSKAIMLSIKDKIYNGPSAKLNENKYYIAISRFSIRYIFPFITISIAAIIKAIVDPFTNITPTLYFIIPIILHSWTGGIRSGFLALAFSVIIHFYFFLEPHGFADKSSDHLSSLVVSSLIKLIILLIIYRLNISRINTENINKEIENERQKMLNIIDSLFTFVVVISKDGKIMEANKATTQLSNKTNTIGKDMEKIYPWSYSPLTQNNLKRYFKESLSGKVVSYDEKMRISEDKFIDVSINIDPVLDNQNKVKYVILSATDISERKENERELQRIYKNYLKLINSNIIGMVIGKYSGEILEMNDAFLKLIGYSRDEIKEKNLKWQDLSFDSYDKENIKSIDESLQSKSDSPLEKEFIHKDGSKVPTIVSGVLINEDEGHILCVILDITERKKLEQKKDEFLSIASHELKTPLTTLKGYVQLLGSKLEERQRENDLFVNRMDNQLVKITDLINDLLDISRIQTGGLTFKQVHFNLGELVEEVVEEMSPLTNKHKINLILPEKSQFVYGDRTRIGQVIINLISNAIKYSPNSDKVNIYLRDEPDKVTVIVEDFGIGIPEDKINKLFEKFFRVEDSSANWQQGLGLGLYISNEIIKKHGSLINVKSEYQKGSIFYFSLNKVGEGEKRDLDS